MPLDSTRIVYEPPAGKATEAPWGVGVARGIVQHFDSVANRDAMWHTPIQHGAVASTAADDKLWYYSGSAWVEVAMLTRDVSIMMPKEGGTFTGPVTWDATAAATFYGQVLVRRAGNAPYIEFQASAVSGTPAAHARYGYIQCPVTYMQFVLNDPKGYFRFVNSQINSAGNPPREIARISDDGLHVNPISASVPGIYSSSPIQVGGDGPQLRVVDTNTATGTADAYIGFYSKGTVTSPGAMGGWVGYNGSAHMYIRNGVANGAMIISAIGTNGDIQLNPARHINFYVNNVLQGLIQGGDFIWGKASSDALNAGVELFGAGSGVEGAVYSTTDKAGIRNLYLRHMGAAAADKQKFVDFWSGTSYLAYIEADTAAPVGVHGVNFLASAPSDYRMKDDLGPVADPTTRMRALNPRHVRWKESDVEFDGFFAHEVAEVVPNAVRGDKDAVYDDAEAETTGVESGAIKPQQFNAAALTPLIVATLQDLINRVEALEAA